MSYLPLAHMFEKVMQCVVFMEGGSVGFFRGDIRLLVDDIRELHPTILPVVPRVLNRLYDKVQGEVSKSAISKLVFDTAIAVKSRELNKWVSFLTLLVSLLTASRTSAGSFVTTPLWTS